MLVGRWVLLGFVALQAAALLAAVVLKCCWPAGRYEQYGGDEEAAYRSKRAAAEAQLSDLRRKVEEGRGGAPGGGAFAGTHAGGGAPQRSWGSATGSASIKAVVPAALRNAPAKEPVAPGQYEEQCQAQYQANRSELFSEVYLPAAATAAAAATATDPSTGCARQPQPASGRSGRLRAAPGGARLSMPMARGAPP